jgi:hypothetical protein
VGLESGCCTKEREEEILHLHAEDREYLLGAHFGTLELSLCSAHLAMETHRGRRGEAAYSLDHSCKWWYASCSGHFYLWEKSPGYAFGWRLWESQSRSGRFCDDINPYRCRESNDGSRAHSQSLYWPVTTLFDGVCVIIMPLWSKCIHSPCEQYNNVWPCQLTKLN